MFNILKIKKIQVGFTTIELLVVVAIIAVLSGIVLTNITQYLNKGKDSSIQGSLSSLSTNAAVYFDTVGNYTIFCDNATAAVPLAAADKAFDGNDTANEVTDCNGALSAWAACGQLKISDSYFCVDSTGTKKIIDTRDDCVTAWALTACP